MSEETAAQCEARAHDVATRALCSLLDVHCCAELPGDGAAGFASLVCVGSTCRPLRNALQHRRAQLARACWLRAFGVETLGHAAAWQAAEMHRGAAGAAGTGACGESRWRWLHALRAGAPVTETTVAHAMPVAQDLQEVAATLEERDAEPDADERDPGRIPDFAALVDTSTGVMRHNAWCPGDSPGFAVVGAEDVAVFTMSYNAVPSPVPYRFTVSLRSGELLRVECDGTLLGTFQLSEVDCAASQLVAFGH
jgi:hypothetical protein